jgi:hypothetical protein
MLTSSILMIRPVSFGFNEQTAESNVFQKRSPDEQNTQAKALVEFDAFVNKLRQNDLDVIVVNDTDEPHTPDSIFPNNWVSFHENGEVYLYPMQAENRRLERRNDIIEQLSNQFIINEVDDLSYFEKQGKFLEGTGSMVLDRENKLAYACISPRTNVEVIDAFCKKSGYQSVLFHAVDQNNKAIYHTNVLMCMGDEFVVICLDAIPDEKEKALLTSSFAKTNKEIIAISQHQLNAFAGNMLELKNKNGEKLLIMSVRAYQSLSTQQIKSLETHCKIIDSDLNVIENIGGGSARCMIAEVHLPLRKP